MTRKVIRIRASERYVRDAVGWVSDSYFAVCPALATGLVRPTPKSRESEWTSCSFEIFNAVVEFGTERQASREGSYYWYKGGIVEVVPKYDEVLAPFAAAFSVANRRNLRAGEKIVVYRDHEGAPIAICIATPVAVE